MGQDNKVGAGEVGTGPGLRHGRGCYYGKEITKRPLDYMPPPPMGITEIY